MNQDRFLFYIIKICDLKNKKIERNRISIQHAKDYHLGPAVAQKPMNADLRLKVNQIATDRKNGPDSFTTEKKEKIPVLLLWLRFH